MATEVVAATAAPQSTLASMSVATKAFVLAHPVALSLVGGAALGIGAYYMLGKMMGKKKKVAKAEPVSTVTEMPAAA